MTNTLNIPEATLAQMGDSSHAINAPTFTGDVFRKKVCRMTDHDEDNGGSTDDVYNMAIFEKSAYGYPWVKDAGSLTTKRQVAVDDIGTGLTTDVTMLFPDHDYAKFG
jgi:hypothetical protein